MDALRRIRDRGVDHRIAGVELDGEPFPALNYTKWPARAGGRQVGQVTSAIYSPRLKKNIGYCWLPAGLATPGNRVGIDSEWGQRTATVTTMPFVDPEKRIPVS
jgi:aminomethyltransferase